MDHVVSPIRSGDETPDGHAAGVLREDLDHFVDAVARRRAELLDELDRLEARCAELEERAASLDGLRTEFGDRVLDALVRQRAAIRRAHHDAGEGRT